MALDARIRLTHQSLPPYLRMRRISQSFVDPTHLILGRINCELLYQKSLCVLYRKFLCRDLGHAQSRAVCTDAALTILDIQAQLQAESRPGGQLFRDQWILSSITLHDFLLAATILCLDLSEFDQSAGEESRTFDYKFKVLKDSHAIFLQQSARFNQARRCADAIGYMLPRIQRQHTGDNEPFNALKSPDDLGQIKQTPHTASESIGSLVREEAQFKDPGTVDWVILCLLSSSRAMLISVSQSLLDQYLNVPISPRDADATWAELLNEDNSPLNDTAATAKT
jgi:hypothetical protein